MKSHNSTIFYQLNILGLLILFQFFFHCDNTENNVRKKIVEHFYGDNKNSGVMISSFKNKKYYEEMIEFHRAIYELNYDWIYFYENLDIKKVDHFVYIIKYTCIFKNRISNDRHIAIKLYFADSDTFLDPVPLKEINYFYKLSSKKLNRIKVLSLWEGDFDSYLEEHLKKSIIIEQ